MSSHPILDSPHVVVGKRYFRELYDQNKVVTCGPRGVRAANSLIVAFFDTALEGIVFVGIVSCI